jgi:nicotinamide mononucleotide transporter
MTNTQRYILESIILALILTTLSYAVGIYMLWITELNWLEVFAVFTSYSCTWLCTRQSRWNYPIGVITTAAYSILFWQWMLRCLVLLLFDYQKVVLPFYITIQNE